MNGDACLPDKTQIARELLAYLRKHPDARDTLDGVLQGWLPGRENQYDPTTVHEVLKDLVLEGTIMESKIPGTSPVYKFNLAKRNKLQELLKKKE